MTLPRGFKAYSQRVAADIRGELQLASDDPLDPWRLADYLGIPCVALSQFADGSSGARHLLHREPSSFSALVLCVGRWRAVVYNDAHARTRQRADIAHELAHALLLHEPHPTIDGLAYDEQQEDEAGWLGAAILVPDQACIQFYRDDVTLPEAAAAMGVSQQLMQWRLNMSGARRRVERARRRAVKAG